MVGIYDDTFINLLRENLYSVKIKNKNIITTCPWCEYDNPNKNHYHLYISLTSPIFHCFHGDCQQSGTVKKLLLKLTGKDNSDLYVDKEKIKEIAKQSFVKFDRIRKKEINIILPDIDENENTYKSLYIKKRTRFQNTQLSNIKGLILNVQKFLDLNQSVIKLEGDMLRLKEYLCSNFIGFLSENKSMVVFRNVDETATFKHFKLFIQKTDFLDYYKIHGNNYHSNDIVLSEGIFDILLEHIFDFTNLKNTVKLYAAGLSTSYSSMLKSITFHEQIFRPNVFILSDKDINLDFYKKLKKYNEHIINNLTVYYNKIGKDFADIPVEFEKFIL